jgi:hypothetical protein
MAADNGTSAPVDPFESFRALRDVYLENMSKVMINAVNSEEYAQVTGAMLNSSLTLSAPFREALDKAMLAALQQLSIPSRQQVVNLAEQLTNLEMRLDDMDAKLDRIAALFSATRSPVAEASPPVSRPSAAAAKSSRRAGARKV